MSRRWFAITAVGLALTVGACGKGSSGGGDGDSGGVGAAEFSRLLYGAAIVAVLLFARDGLAGLVHGIRKERVA